MASGSTSSLLDSSDETFNGMKLMRLILDGGTEALRKIFQRIHPGNLQVVLSCKSSLSTCTSSTCNYCRLIELKNRKIINQNQWDKLYPARPNKPNINDFDITLLSVLLRNICGLSPPCTVGIIYRQPPIFPRKPTSFVLSSFVISILIWSHTSISC